MTESLLKVSNLAITFPHENQKITVVNGVSFALPQGEVLGLVGESGCGKSLTALSLLRLVPSPGKISNGQILWQGKELLQLPLPEIYRLRGKEISIIFQNPLTSFNPVQTVGKQLSEALELHSSYSPPEVRDLVLTQMQQVGLPQPLRQYQSYPHELSGGMRQRALIAMALIGQPQLLIADEPTTALDVTIQAQILDLLQLMQKKQRMGVLLITHNLGIVARIADQVAVMYAGKIVETAPVQELFQNPLHPYTQGLLGAIPRLDRQEILYTIPGTVPDPAHLPRGCAFAPRCPERFKVCLEQIPELSPNSPQHQVACWLKT